MKNKKLISITLLLSSTFTMMAGAIIAPSLPQIERIFQDTDNIALLTRLILSLPAIFTAIFAPVFGLLSDKLGRKNLLLMSLILYAIGGFSGYLLNDIYLILAGRALLGISVAGIMTISSTLIGDYFTGSERSKFIGLQGAFMGFGGVVFVSIAGVLADISWNLPFTIYLLSIIAFITATISLKEAPKQKQVPQYESKTDYNKLKALKVYTLIFIGIAFFYMMPVQLPFLLDKLQDMSNTKIGMVISTMQLSSAIVALFYKRIKAWFSFEIIFALVLLFMGLGYTMIAYFQHFGLILFAVVVAGIGVGLLMPLGNLWIMDLAPENKRGIMVGNVTTAIFLGQFMSPLLLQPIINGFGIVNLFLIAGYTMVTLSIFLYLIGEMRKRAEVKYSTAKSK